MVLLDMLFIPCSRLQSKPDVRLTHSNKELLTYLLTYLLRLHYCAPAWSGYCIAADRDSLESFLRRCNRLGYCDVDTQSVVEQF